MAYRRIPSSALRARNAVHQAGAGELPEDLIGVCVRWALRLLVEFGGAGGVIHEHHSSDPLLLRFVGLQVAQADDEPFEGDALRMALTARHRAVMREAVPEIGASPLADNLDWLAAQLGLSDVERRILLFSLLEATCPALRTAIDTLGEMNTSRLQATLAVLLDLPPEQVRAALDPESALMRARVLAIDESSNYNFHMKLEMIEGLADRMLCVHPEPFGLFGASFVIAPPAALGLERYPHLGRRIGQLRAYLAHAIAHRTPGVNVLIYGPPGTGKTEFVRALAKDLGAELFEVAVEDRRGDQLRGAQRLSGYRLSQQVLGNRPGTLLVFDEIEDIRIGSDEDGPGHTPNPGRKGWFNQLLERNPVPALWISNDIDFLDPAHLRRFDFHLEIGMPPVRVRAGMLADQVRALGATDAWCERVAANDRLAPAVIARAAKVVGAIRSTDTGASVEQLLEDVLEGALSAQSVGFRRGGALAAGALAYRLDTVNADCDLQGLLDGLRDTGEGRLCLYGAPGTGKSAFAAHVAAELGRPPMLRRASDLLGRYVGETEERMARMFAEARAERAVLILDEADSFLRSRESAQHGWEVTAINEMLTQIEAFDGIFFATTNLMSQLDPACLRRFDLKIRFDPLSLAQFRTLFAEAARALGLDSE
ncbi:MAG: hypothetical protein RIS35_654, partial [Pseudomonadota bacterium]